MKLREHIGKNIREARKTRGMTQTELARAAGVDKATVSRAEHAQSSVSAVTLAHMAKVLGVEDMNRMFRRRK